MAFNFSTRKNSFVPTNSKSSVSVLKNKKNNSARKKSDNEVYSSPEEIIENLKKIIKLVPSGITMDDLLSKYEEIFSSTFDFTAFGFQSMEEYLEKMPGFKIKKVGDEVKIFPASSKIYPENKFKTDNINNWLLNGRHLTVEKNADPIDTTEHLADDSVSIYAESVACPEPGISEDLKEKFRQVLKRHPRGIFGHDFLPNFRRVYNKDFELQDIGYVNLIDLVYDLPDVFHIVKSPHGSNNWKLLDAQTAKDKTEIECFEETESRHSSSLELVNTTAIIRRLLQAQPEGIFIDEFLTTFGVNCEKTLNVKEFGFDDLTKFLYAIKDDVPLTFDYFNVRTKVQLAFNSPYSSPLPVPKIPDDVVLPGDTFSTQVLPDLPPHSYFPAYFANINNPFDFCIQLKGDDTSKKLDEILEDLQNYKEDEYNMQPRHVVVGAVCSAVWREDKYRYRGIIESVKESYVEVFFVDYGNAGVCDKYTLRYLKKEHFALPAQGINARLAMVSSKGPEFDIKAGVQLKELVDEDDVLAQVFISRYHTNIISLIIFLKSHQELCLNIHLFQLGLVNMSKEFYTSTLFQLPYQERISSNFPFHEFNSFSHLPVTSQLHSALNPIPPIVNYGNNRNSSEKEAMNNKVLVSPETYNFARYVLRMTLQDGYNIHIVLYDHTPYVSSYDIFKLFWPYQHDYEKLQWRFRLYNAKFKSTIVTEEECPQMFKQLRSFLIEDIRKEGTIFYIVLYPLNDLIAILNTFGHPSFTVRKEVKKIIEEFNPYSLVWRSFTTPEITNNSYIYNLDEFKSLCLFDLRAKLIFYKHKKFELLWKIKNGAIIKTSNTEFQLQHFERLYEKFQIRIEEIEFLCKQ